MQYVVVKNKRLWLLLGFYPLDWGWVWELKKGIINCGPLCAWWHTGKLAADLIGFPRYRWDR